MNVWKYKSQRPDLEISLNDPDALKQSVNWGTSLGAVPEVDMCAKWDAVNNVSILKHFQVYLPFMFLFFLLFSKVVCESVSSVFPWPQLWWKDNDALTEMPSSDHFFMSSGFHVKRDKNEGIVW